MARPSSAAPPATARTLAARVVHRVFRDAAYAAAALDAELSRHTELDARDRALATELVYGVLRTRGALERHLAPYIARPVSDAMTRVHLLVAAYQLLLLDRVPAFAAVDAAVSAVRAERGARLAGFVTAVLRRLAASGERIPLQDALLESGPEWLIERLTAVVGRDETVALLGGAGPPELGLRLVAGREPPEWLSRERAGRVSPRARLVRDLGDPRQRPGYAEGAFVLQEEGAQAVALLLGARPGERVLDACAGRGQKTTLLAELVGPAGVVWASDLSPKKLSRIPAELTRLGLPAVETRAENLELGPGALPDGFDRVLVDAPCTGTGTLRHRPEIRGRLGPEDPARLAAVQARILRTAATRARPGGRVVYAVCSVLPDEGEGVVERVRDLLEPAPFDAPELEGRLSLAGTTALRLLPGAHGTDGYFVASFVKR